jgi:hypothetical protein
MWDFMRAILFLGAMGAGGGLARAMAERREALETAEEKAGVPKPD